MKIIKSLSLSLLVFSSSLCLGNSKWTLNGAAEYEELNQTLYVGGLYLEKPSDDLDYIFSASTDKKLRIIVKREQWSKRTWSNHWRQRLAVNPNPGMTSNISREDLAKFVKLLRANLVKGDEIDVSYTSGQTLVLLNRDSAIKSQGSDLIDSLLKTWLAEVPPSSGFKKAILQSATKSAWIVEPVVLENHQVSAARRALYSSWLRVDDKKVETKVLVDREKKEDEIAQKKLALEKKREAEAELRAKAKKVQIEQQKMRELSDFRRQEQDYYHSLLQWQFQRYADRHISRFVPEAATRNSDDSNSSSKWASFTYSRSRSAQNFKGNDGLLNDKRALSALEKVVAAASPHVSIPSTLAGKTWTISVQYRHTKQELNVPPPEKPENLNADDFSDTARRSVVDDYQKYLLSSVQGAIPILENDLTGTRENRLKLQVTVDKWGEIKKIDFLRKPRNPYSISFFRDKLQLHSPFRVLPQEFLQQEFTIEVDFRKR